MYVKLDDLPISKSQKGQWDNPYDWCEQCDMAPIFKAVDKLTAKYTLRPSETPSRAETGIFVTKMDNEKQTQLEKIDITPVISELADIYNEMTTVTEKLHKIVSDPQYSFF